MAMAQHVSILFVCLGNICRSPLAEAAFCDVAERAGLRARVDSAGIGNWHVGKPPDPRAQAVALRYNVDISGLRARQVSHRDYTGFTHIFAMDQDNLDVLLARCPDKMSAEVSLLLDLVPGRTGQSVADPYYGGADGFETTWNEVSEAARHLVGRLL